MPSVLESFAVELGASEPWPEDAKLYQPDEEKQILLSCSANSLSVQAFLRMCGLNFTVVMRPNAEHMSPSGNIPFLRCGTFVVAEFDPIVALVNTKGIHLSDHLGEDQRTAVRVHMSAVNSILVNAELYFSWCDKATFKEVTKPRYGSVYPWPLNHFLIWRKQSQMRNHLSKFEWANKSLEDVLVQVGDCCNALSQLLDSNDYFFNNRPTELDALVYGHIYAILTTSLPDNRLASVISKHKNLIDLVLRIDREFLVNKNKPDHQ